MDRLNKARGTVRAKVTRTITKAEQLLAQEPQVVDDLRAVMIKLSEVSDELGELNQKVTDAMLDADCSEEELENESIAVEDYEDRMRIVRIKLESLLDPRPPSPAGSASGVHSATGKKRTYKLPKIEIRKFNGDLKEWLGFWSQFQKIDEDEELHDSDKLQYLVQAMVVGSRARKLVDSYPQSAGNYPKVVAALKDRFGDKVLIAEVYVRELLKFVNTNLNKSVTLSNMYDELEAHLRALETLGVTTEQSAMFLYPMVESSLPLDIIKVWQRSSLSGYGDEVQEKSADARLKDLMKFLRQEVKGEERLMYVTGGGKDTARGFKKTAVLKKMSQEDEDIPTVAGLFISEKSCIFCSKGHDSKDCWTAKGMTLEEKNKSVREHRSCYCCLKPGHQSKRCKIRVVCPVCSKRHHVVLCPELPAHKKSADKREEEVRSKNQPENLSSNLACSSSVVLKTLMVRVYGINGSMKIRAILDDGSQRSYVSKRIVDQLGLKIIGEEEVQHTLFGGLQTDVQKYRNIEVQLQNLNKSGVVRLNALDKNVICGDIPQVHKGPWMKKLKDNKIFLSDLGEGCPHIDLLIGAKELAKLYTGKQVKITDGLLAVETVLGWTLMGTSPRKSSHTRTDSTATLVTCMQLWEASVENLWSLETIGIKSPEEYTSKQEREDKARKYFLKTVTRTDEGRYSVSLPWVDGHQNIPDNRSVAEKRLQSATRSLIAAKKYEEYEEIFRSWLQENIIEEVREDELFNHAHYLPHRAVFKPESSTTPIRPVFDASCKIGRNPSLNDCLEKGPNLLELIPSILLRFREKKFGVISDIRKAFLMIEINQQDRNFLRFLWWEDPTLKKFRVFRHKRVVFGVNCSPFLLGAVIEFHLKNSADDKNKEVVEQLRKSLYVDNCVTSVDSFEEFENFKNQATKLMADGMMELRLWECNSVESPGIGSLTGRECGLGDGRDDCSSQSNTSSVLGIKWDKREDSLSCDLNLEEIPEKITKRVILSIVQKIFDPLGFLCPVLLCPKKILQESWIVKKGWDEELEEEIRDKFEVWHKELHLLKMLKIPRNSTGGVSDHLNWQLHVFSDASKDAYAAAVFLRTEGERVTVQLLQAKARVAPLKGMTIPRLELLGCTIASRLADSVKKALAMTEVPTLYWCDSTTALSWIKRNDEWGTFVGNRVKEILKLTKADDWRHVPGSSNPADLPSRGCSPDKFLKLRWWEGPAWLRMSSESWPKESDIINEADVLAERRKTMLTCMISQSSEEPWYAKHSVFSKNVRIVAWMIRFLRRTQKASEIKGNLTVMEIEAAEKFIIRLIQREVFPVDSTQVGGVVVQKDEDGLLRVKTKLLYRDDLMSFKFPLVLPQSHVLVERLIREYHLDYGHAGIQLLMGKIREKFWILQGRKTIRKVLKSCVSCKRYTEKKTEVIPAPLPSDRVRDSRVFETVGVDLAGPLFIKKKKKAWIVLYTCAVYRGVHLEMVKSLSTEAFLERFQRFVSRRGRPAIVYSDNGTNFVGAANLWKRLDWERITRECGIRRIQWKFNPPSAAWWGGFWERLIRSIKNILRRVLSKSSLSYDKLRNMLCEVEAFINARPLTTVTEDPQDLSPLSPAMFMHELPNSHVTDLELLDSSGFQAINVDRKKVLEELKMRFRREYLALLVQRGKEPGAPSLKVGDVVLVGADNKKRWEWPMARIEELIPGRDGNIRVARVKTGRGSMVRPLQRLYLLEVSRGDLEKTAVPTLKVTSDNVTTEEFSPAEEEEQVVQVPRVSRFGRVLKVPDRF